MSLSDRLRATEPAPRLPQRDRPSVTMEWDGSRGLLQTEPMSARPASWDESLREAGMDPAEVEVVEPVQVRGWQTTVDGEPVWLHYYRLTVRRRRAVVDVDDLVRAARRGKRKEPPAPTADAPTFLLALGDLQLGKVDGDGAAGTTARYLDLTKAAVARYRRVGKGCPVLIAHLGDCIEGMVSQGGANTWRTPLTTTEQVRLYRRLVLEQVKAFAGVAPSVVMAGVPGNHDEAHRPIHTYGDSWAIDALAAVKDALDFAGGYDHVTVLAPERDELTLTLDASGTRVGLAHGHQFGRGTDGWRNWWKGQQHGRQPIGDVDLLLAGHLHYLRIERDGTAEGTPARTFLQVPSLESESTWWRHRKGDGGDPGVITALLSDGTWRALEVL